MKKLLGILALVIVPCMMFLFVGCSSNEPTESELDSDDSQSPPNNMPGVFGEYRVGVPESITVVVGETFIVALESNPTTGYSWQAEFDSRYIKLTGEEFIGDSNLLGAGGVEKREFTALKPGDVKLTMTYKRPWENEFAEQHVIPVKITAQGQ